MLYIAYEMLRFKVDEVHKTSFDVLVFRVLIMELNALKFKIIVDWRHYFAHIST